MANQYISEYTGKQIDDAVGQAHEHNNKEVLDSISQESIEQWGKSGRPAIYLSADLSFDYSPVTCIVFSGSEPTAKKFSDLIDEAGSIDNLIYNYDFFYGDPGNSQTKYTLDVMYSSDAGSLMFTSSIDSREHGCKYIEITYNEVTGDLNASYSYLNSASKTSKGIMQVGDYLTENNGVVSVDVKQTYSSTSKNPLSGVAVAQAIKEYANQAFANALRGSASGNAVALTDVSPVSHTLDVKVRSKNMLNQSTTETGTLPQGSKPINVRDFKDNTWYAGLTLSGYYDPNTALEYALNGNNITVKTGTSESSSLYGLSKALKCEPNTTYWLSYVCENGKSKNASGIGFYGADKKHMSFTYCDSGGCFTTPDNCYWIIVCFHGNLEGTEVTYSNIQLERGTVPTDYTPYVNPSEIKVKRCGKNILPYPYSGFGSGTTVTISGVTFTDNGDGSVTITGQNDEPSYLRFFLNGSANSSGNLSLPRGTYAINGSLTAEILSKDGSKKYFTGTNNTFTLGEGDSVNRIWIQIKAGGATDFIVKPQLEIGDTSTEYEPYVAAEYTPADDGTVDGVTSLYPNTSLTTDADGVVIDVGYNRDVSNLAKDINELKKSDSFVSIPITFDINKGFYISPSKKWVNISSLFDTSNPIPVIGGMILKYKHTFANGNIAQIAFASTADRTDKAIMSVIVTKDAEDIITTVPEGANYVYVCIQNNKDTINSISLSYDSSDIGLNIVNKLEELNNRSKSLLISLPEKYDLVVGDTFELFWKGIILANDINQYNIKVTCSIGNCFKNKYMVTPAAVGNYALKISVYNDGGELLKSAETTLVVSETATSPDTIKNILCVGDSLLSGGQWAYEACRRLIKNDGSPKGLGLSNISFIGSKTLNNVGYEGYGGWTFDSYNTANVLSSYVWITTVHTKTGDDQHSLYRDANGAIWKIETIETGKLKMIRTSGSSDMPSSGTLTYVSGGTDTSDIIFTASELAAGNPFWNETANAVDFTAYAAKFEASTIDYCYILLGWNMSTKTEEEIKASARTFIDNLLADFPDCKITLLGLEIPSLDGCGVNYGCSWNWFEKARYVFDLNDWYAEIAEEYGNVNFVNVAGQFDTENNMITGTRQVNVRNTKTETYQTNGVHPDVSGYNQIADAVFRHLNSIL